MHQLLTLTGEKAKLSIEPWFSSRFVYEVAAALSIDRFQHQYVCFCQASPTNSFIASLFTVFRAFMAACGIKSYSMEEVDKYGLKDMMRRIFGTIDPL